MIDAVQDQITSGLDAETIAASNALAHQVAASDWLGPMAPVALSPFFGLATLSGVATYGPEWLQERSSLFSDASSLNNPYLFWTMAVLAVLTSLPRFTKVSKPIALLAENLEAYSVVIILVVVRFSGMMSEDASPQVVTLDAPVFLAAGITELPLDIFMSIFAAINILVINVVKLFFEFLVWITPFPTVDLMLEAANKSVSAALMALYMYSPTLATIANLVILVICLFVVGWCYRRLHFYKELACGPILAWLFPGWFAQKGKRYRVFCTEPLGGLPSYTALNLTIETDGSIQVHGRWLWKQMSRTIEAAGLKYKTGLIRQKLIVEDAEESYVFLHRRWVPGDAAFQEQTSATPEVSV